MGEQERFETADRETRQLLASNQWHAALLLARDLTTAYPDAPRPWQILTDVATAARHRDPEHAARHQAEALGAINRVIALHPTGAMAFLTRARLHFDAGNFDQAERDSRTVLDRRPGSGAALFVLGSIAFRRDDWRQSEDFYREAIVQNPNDAMAYNALGVALSRQNRHRDALAPYRMALWLGDDAPASYYRAYALSLEALGETEEADAVRKRAARLAP